MTHLWEALCRAYRVLGFESATKGDKVFRDLVLARIIEPTSKIDAERVLSEVGVAPASYATVKRRLPVYRPTCVGGKRWPRHAQRMPGWGRPAWCSSTCRRCTSRPMPVTGSASPGSPRRRRLEPQITLGLLTDAAGFPLTVEAFEGNKAETATMLPVINAFKAAHQLTDVTVVADAGMISEANQVALQAAGLSFILGARIPYLPDVVREWRDKHPDEAIPDGLVLTQPWPATSSGEGPRDPGSGHPLPVPPRPGPAHAARDRRAGRQSRTCRRRACPGQTQPLHPALRCDQERQPRRWRPRPAPWPGGRDTPPTSSTSPPDVRHRRLPPAVAHREGLPDVQARPAGPPDLPPHPRIHRGAPEHRVRRDGRQPLHRDTKPVGASRNSSAPPAATAPSRSKPADKP